MKKFLRYVTVVGMILLVAFASFENNDAKAGWSEKTGIVVSTTVSVREEPDTRSDRYTKLSNGNLVQIVGEVGDWYIIDLTSLGFKEGEGYALKNYIDTDVYYITLSDTVKLWADPFGTGVANGEKNKGTQMLVLYENAEWYVVQTRENSAGSSFIRKKDLNNSGQQNSYISSSANKKDNLYVVTAKSLRVRNNPDDAEKAVGFLHNGDVVKVIRIGEYYTSIEYEIAGQITECWVHTEYLKKIYK